MEVFEGVRFWLWGSPPYTWQSPVNSSNPCLGAHLCFKNHSCHPTEGSSQPMDWCPWEAPALPPGLAWGDGERISLPSTGLCFLGSPEPHTFHRRFLTWGRNVSLLIEMTAEGRGFRLVVEEHTCNEWSNLINADNLMWKVHNQLTVEGWLVLFSLFP